jgi:hypothetical protein
MAKNPTKNSTKPKKTKATTKPETGPIPQIWKCKVDWCTYKKKPYVKGEQVMISPQADSENDVALNRYFEKVAVKVDTIISEPAELAEGE